MKKNILKINNLSITTKVNTNLYLVDSISFSVEEGKTTCIVGESGSGKSLTALSIIRLLSPQLKMSGEILFNNEDICKMSELEIRQKRGLDIAMIFQEPMTSLNPVLTIGYQIKEAITVHSDSPNNEINKKVEELKEETKDSLENDKILEEIGEYHKLKTLLSKKLNRVL